MERPSEAAPTAPEDLREQVARLTQENERLQAENATQAKRIVELESAASTDRLTGVHNRAAFDTELAMALRVARREEGDTRGTSEGAEHLALVIVDIDLFKQFNDTYGHLIGDEVLRRVTSTLSAGVRDTDTVARWGGEELAILLRGTSAANAEQVAEKLRAAVEAIDLSDIDTVAAGTKVTASFGVASSEADVNTPEDLFKLADGALYASKKSGRNRVTVA